MDIPKPPDDQELKTIIDKLANFVARNGPEFEEMTKQKQRDNPKFSFLFSGPNFPYYQYRVNSEQAKIKIGGGGGPQKQGGSGRKTSRWEQAPPQDQPVFSSPSSSVGNMPIPPGGVIVPQAPQGNNPPNIPPPCGPGGGPWQPNPEIQNLEQQIVQVQQQITSTNVTNAEQISQSEQNLAAQLQNMRSQQQVQLESLIRKNTDQKILDLCEKCDIKKEDLNKFAQPIIDTCTKDAISGGKNWIFNHNQTPDHCDLITTYLLQRIMAPDATFQCRLHLIYLINDILHHCVRKNADELKRCVESIVIPIFCKAHEGTGEDKRIKLLKLLNIWEQNKYFDPSVLEQMKNPTLALQNYQANQMTENAALCVQFSSSVQAQYAQLEKQHHEFVAHCNNQVAQFNQQLQNLQTQLAQAKAAQIPPASIPIPVSQDPSMVQAGPRHPGGPPPPFPPNFNPSQPPPGFGGQQPSTRFGGFNEQRPPAPHVVDYQHGQVVDYQHGAGPPQTMGPHGGPRPHVPLPDFSRPPPGFLNQGPGPHGQQEDLMPNTPYYDLPAGLMAPLVKLEDSEYKPLDPKDIRLPPPMAPSERLLAAVEAFYCPPSHERPRDGEGWEKLGLYEYFKAKQAAKKLKENDRNRSKSASPEPIKKRSKSKSPSPPFRGRRRRYNSGERRPVRRSRSKSPPRRSRSRSRSPPIRRKKGASPSTDSPLPYQRSSRSRSPSPPGYAGFGMAPSAPPQSSRLGEDNKGHQLLKKMGWSGAGGLGQSEQGIIDPINAGEVRDRSDMYRGVGVNISDPFEQFRKNKSQGFMQRIRSSDRSSDRNSDRDRSSDQKPPSSSS